MLPARSRRAVIDIPGAKTYPFENTVKKGNEHGGKAGNRRSSFSGYGRKCRGRSEARCDLATWLGAGQSRRLERLTENRGGLGRRARRPAWRRAWGQGRTLLRKAQQENRARGRLGGGLGGGGGRSSLTLLLDIPKRLGRPDGPPFAFLAAVAAGLKPTQQIISHVQ